MDRLLELTARIQGQPQMFGIGTPNQSPEDDLSPEAFAKIVGEEGEYMLAGDFEKLVETAKDERTLIAPVLTKIKPPTSVKASEAFATTTTTSSSIARRISQLRGVERPENHSPLIYDLIEAEPEVVDAPEN